MAIPGFLLLMNPSTAVAQQQYSASESWTVGPGDYILDNGVPGCGSNSLQPINEAAQALAAYQAGGIYGALGAVLDTAARAYHPQSQGFVGQVLDAIYGGNRYANCVPVSVVIPAGARISGYVFEASDWTGSRACVIGQDCQIGWSRFDSPQIIGAGQSTIITSVFRNWSGDRTRSATMTVYFIY